MSAGSEPHRTRWPDERIDELASQVRSRWTDDRLDDLAEEVHALRDLAKEVGLLAQQMATMTERVEGIGRQIGGVAQSVGRVEERLASTVQHVEGRLDDAESDDVQQARQRKTWIVMISCTCLGAMLGGLPEALIALAHAH